MGLFCNGSLVKGSSAISGTNSKRPSDPSMELANNTRNDNNTTAPPSGPEPPANKAIKVHIYRSIIYIYM